MTKLKRIEGEVHWVKDTSSGAILNTDVEGLESYKKMRDLKNRQRNKLEELNNEVNSLKSDINEIKGLLLTMVGKNNGS